MKKLGITYDMKRHVENGTEEVAETYIELPISDYNADKVLKKGTSHMLEGTIDRICMLQGYFFDGIRRIEEI